MKEIMMANSSNLFYVDGLGVEGNVDGEFQLQLDTRDLRAKFCRYKSSCELYGAFGSQCNFNRDLFLPRGELIPRCYKPRKVILTINQNGNGNSSE
jgi:hypothetical protein